MSKQENNENICEDYCPDVIDQDNIEPYYDGYESIDQDSNDSHQTTTQVNNEITNQTTPVNNDVKEKEKEKEKQQQPSIFSWNGQRPFAGAVDHYINYHLNPAIDKAKKNLEKHPQWKFAKVELPLFETIDVLCADQYGNPLTKHYSVHEAHYGPLVHIKYDENNKIPKEHQKWHNFYNRQTSVWVSLELNKGTKLSGGDGSGRGGTECSPFRDAQMNLIKENLFLIDASDVEYDDDKDRFWYKINITLNRSPLPNGPIRIPHGYGFIPGLGSSTKSPINPIVNQPVNQNQSKNSNLRSNGRNGNPKSRPNTGSNSKPKTNTSTNNRFSTKSSNTKVWKEKTQ